MMASDEGKPLDSLGPKSKESGPLEQIVLHDGSIVDVLRLNECTHPSLIIDITNDVMYGLFQRAPDQATLRSWCLQLFPNEARFASDSEMMKVVTQCKYLMSKTAEIETSSLAKTSNKDYDKLIALKRKKAKEKLLQQAFFKPLPSKTSQPSSSNDPLPNWTRPTCVVPNCRNSQQALSDWQVAPCDVHRAVKSRINCECIPPFTLHLLDRSNVRQKDIWCQIILSKSGRECTYRMLRNARVCSEHFEGDGRELTSTSLPSIRVPLSLEEIYKLCQQADFSTDDLPRMPDSAPITQRNNSGAKIVTVRLVGAEPKETEKKHIERRESKRTRDLRSTPTVTSTEDNAKTKGNAAAKESKTKSSEKKRPLNSVMAAEPTAESQDSDEKDEMDTETPVSTAKQQLLADSSVTFARKCTVDGCKNTSLLKNEWGKPYRFFELPSDMQLALRWIVATKSSVADQKTWMHDYTAQPAACRCKFRVCSDHFLDGKPSPSPNDVPRLLLPVNDDGIAQSETTGVQCAMPLCAVNGLAVPRSPVSNRMMRFFRFPSDPHRALIWLRRIVESHPNWTAPRLNNIGFNFLCELHFPVDDVRGVGNLDEPPVGVAPSLFIDRPYQFSKDSRKTPPVAPRIGNNRKCLVRECPIWRNTKKQDNSLFQMYPVPHRGAVRVAWLEALMAADRNFKPQHPDVVTYVCERHFSFKRPLGSDPPIRNLDPITANAYDVDRPRGSPTLDVSDTDVLANALLDYQSAVADVTCRQLSTGDARVAVKWCCAEVEPLKTALEHFERKIGTLFAMIRSEMSDEMFEELRHRLIPLATDDDQKLSPPTVTTIARAEATDSKANQLLKALYTAKEDIDNLKSSHMLDTGSCFDSSEPTPAAARESEAVTASADGNELTSLNGGNSSQHPAYQHVTKKRKMKAGPLSFKKRKEASVK